MILQFHISFSYFTVILQHIFINHFVFLSKELVIIYILMEVIVFDILVYSFETYVLSQLGGDWLREGTRGKHHREDTSGRHFVFDMWFSPFIEERTKSFQCHSFPE